MADMTYKTGRSRTLEIKFSASVSGIIFAEYNEWPFNVLEMGGGGNVGLGGVTLYHDSGHMPPPDYQDWVRLFARVSLSRPGSTALMEDVMIAETTTAFDGFELSATFDVEFTFSIDVDEYCTFSYMGGLDGDSIEGTCHFFERPRIGGLVTGAAEWSDGSLSYSDEIESFDVDFWAPEGVLVYSQQFLGGAGFQGHTLARTGKSVTCTYSFRPFDSTLEFEDMSGDLAWPGYEEFASFGMSSSEAISFTTTDDGPPGQIQSSVSGVIDYVWPARYSYRSPSFQAMDGNYGSADNLQVEIIDGLDPERRQLLPAASNFSISQGGSHAYVSASMFNESTLEEHYKEWESGRIEGEISPVFAKLQSESLTGVGDDPLDDRLQFRGIAWDALELSHNSALLIDACDSTANWTPGPNVTLLTPGSNLSISSSANEGYATLAVGSNDQVWEAFRYLRITASASLPVTVGVLIAGQLWELSLTTSNQPVLLDLCCSSEEDSSVGVVQSRYPSLSTDPSRSQTAYAFGWGVNFCEELRIVGIPLGYSITLSDISLVVTNEASVSLAAPFRTKISGRQLFAFLQTDDRISDWPGSDSGGIGTIQELASYLGWVPGVSANALPPLPDTYHSSTLPAFLLGGGGMSFDWSTNTWTTWLDRSIVSEVTIPAQDLFDSVTGYPGIGNPWDGSDYPSPSADEGIPLVIGKLIRGQGAGLIYLNDNQPYSDVGVTAFSDDGAFLGAGVTSSNGAYQTGSPFGFGNRVSFTGIVAPGLDVQHDGLWQNRQRYRVSIRTLPAPCAGADPRTPWSCGSGTLNVTVGPNCAVAVGCDCEQPTASALPAPGPQ